MLADGLPAGVSAETSASDDSDDTEAMIAVEPLEVYGDSAYGTGALLAGFERSGVEAYCKTQPPRAPEHGKAGSC